MGPITTGRTVISGTHTTMDITGPIHSFHLLSFRTGTTHTMCRHPLLFHHILEKDIGRASRQNDLLLLLFSAAKDLEVQNSARIGEKELAEAVRGVLRSPRCSRGLHSQAVSGA